MRNVVSPSADSLGLLVDDGEDPRVAWCRRDGGNEDVGWAEALDGCAYVWHLTSPVPARLPKNEAELISPAVDGTLRVLRAAAQSGAVRRVVMTSSTDAIVHRHAGPARVRTEADWSNPERLALCLKTKLHAGFATLDFAADHTDHPVEFVAIIQGLVPDPLQRGGRTPTWK